MARANRSSGRSNNPNAGHTKPKPSGSKANAAGYAKRHSKKAKTLNGSAADVYEYAPESTRRSKVTLDLDREEAAEYGVGMDGDNEDQPGEELHARLIGERGENEMIDSGDDEEIDSDAAFEESDEERFAGFFSAKGKKKAPRKKKSAVRFADVDLNEDEDMEGGEGDADSSDPEADLEGDDEFYDVLDVLDGRAGVEHEDDAADVRKPSEKGSKVNGQFATGDGEERDEEMEEDDEDEDSEGQDSEDEEKFAFSASDAEDSEPEALDELQNFISSLDPTAKKRKASDRDAPTANSTDRLRKQRRLMLKEYTEAGAENEFRAQTSGSKINLDDLLAPLASQSSTLQSLKQSTKVLGSSSSKTKTLSAPLPQRAQERLDREAAYEQTKEEVDKWSGTMKRIREAEHLSFPLQAPTAGRVSNLELAAKFKPTTALESSVDALLKSAKLREEDIQDTEETMLKMNKLSVEEVEQRRAELRKMRELMFRAEIKARRIGKIKSKTYRKIKRKERERLGEKLAEDGGEGSEGEEEKLKREVERARERATLRHKHTGKWAKQMRGREGMGGEGRREIEEMLERGEKLRRRIRGVGSDDESGGEEEEEDDDMGDAEDGIERIKQGAFDELKRVEMEDGSVRIEGGEKSKSIFEMKFMKDAMARQQLAADRMADDFVHELGVHEDDEDASDFEESQTREVGPDSGIVTQRTGGRISYHPGSAANKRSIPTRPLGSLASDTSSVTLKSTDLLSPPQSPLDFQRPNVPLPMVSESNPWLARDPESTTSAKVAKKNNEVVVGKDSTAMSKSKNKMKKLAKKNGEGKAKAVDDAVVEISTDQVLTLADSSSAPVKPKSAAGPNTKKSKPVSPNNAAKPSTAATHGHEAEENEVNSEVEEQEKALDLKGKGKAAAPHAFQQRDLVALAFAGDNVVHEFEELKKRELAADAPREVDTTIPGWGSWGGTGTRAAPPKPHRIKKIAGIDPTTRADYGKAHVIISEKRDKKAAKYLVKDLPYPYTSKAQFEKTMERPLGTEWNTRVGFQRGTLPRVVKKPGMIINPLEKLNS
ncbi:Utp14-domain-containing protein [Lyophyllum atratum]|nr:Utp14-domain-containing protein [Lyophyllum atratum]